MRLPSVKTLSRHWPDKAVELRALMAIAEDTIPGRSAVLHGALALLEGFSIEAIRGHNTRPYWYDIAAEYVNLGDTYTTTILYDVARNRFEVTSWGDWFERNEKRLGLH